jgi:hypothetical protein
MGLDSGGWENNVFWGKSWYGKQAENSGNSKLIMAIWWQIMVNAPTIMAIDRYYGKTCQLRWAGVDGHVVLR